MLGVVCQRPHNALFSLSLDCEPVRVLRSRACAFQPPHTAKAKRPAPITSDLLPPWFSHPRVSPLINMEFQECGPVKSQNRIASRARSASNKNECLLQRETQKIRSHVGSSCARAFCFFVLLWRCWLHYTHRQVKRRRGRMQEASVNDVSDT